MPTHGWALRCALWASGGVMFGAAADGAANFHRTIEPLLSKYCYDCHGNGVGKGKVPFDEFASDAEVLARRDLWLAALKNVRAGLMPPREKDISPPSEEEVRQLANWIKFDAFGIDPANPDPGRVTARRLNRVEYRNTIRDLMGIDFNSEVEFPPDDSGNGFDNNGDVLTVSPLLLEKYLTAAETIVDRAVPKNHARFLFRVEEVDPRAARAPFALVDEYALASRLSYFLWSTMPDEELFRLAARGELRRELRPQMTRMLGDPRAQALVRNFTGQWLQARDVEFVPINARLVLPPNARRNKDGRLEFDSAMRKAMRSETEMYFDYVIREDRSVLELSCDSIRKSGRCDSGYSCAYQYNLSWQSPSTPMAPEANPRLVFERLFGGRSERVRLLRVANAIRGARSIPCSQCQCTRNTRLAKRRTADCLVTRGCRCNGATCNSLTPSESSGQLRSPR